MGVSGWQPLSPSRVAELLDRVFTPKQPSRSLGAQRPPRPARGQTRPPQRGNRTAGFHSQRSCPECGPGRGGAGAEELPGRRDGVLTHTPRKLLQLRGRGVGADTPACTRRGSRADGQGPGTRGSCCRDRALTGVGEKTGSGQTPSETKAGGGRPRPAAESIRREPACLTGHPEGRAWPRAGEPRGDGERTTTGRRGVVGTGSSRASSLFVEPAAEAGVSDDVCGAVCRASSAGSRPWAGGGRRNDVSRKKW